MNPESSPAFQKSDKSPTASLSSSPSTISARSNKKLNVWKYDVKFIFFISFLLRFRLLVLGLTLRIVLFLLFWLLLVYLDHVFVLQLMEQANLLGNELARPAPANWEFKVLVEVSVDLIADAPNICSISVLGKHDWIVEIRQLASFFGENAN